MIFRGRQDPPARALADTIPLTLLHQIQRTHIPGRKLLKALLPMRLCESPAGRSETRGACRLHWHRGQGS